MSGLVGDNTARASGVIAAAGGGKILQVVSVKDTGGPYTHSSNNWNAGGNGLTCTITPSATSSKIYVSWVLGVYSGGDFAMSIFRDIGGAGATNLGATGDNGLSRIQGKNSFGGGLVDSPNTTSAVEYMVYMNAIDGSTTSINYSSAYSYMSVMEIGA
jgi:hypothetical protein